MTTSTARRILFADEGRIQSVALEAEVVERHDTLGAYSVEAIDDKSEGDVYMVVFYGPSAKDRALEYAHAKYSQIRVS